MGEFSVDGANDRVTVKGSPEVVDGALVFRNDRGSLVAAWAVGQWYNFTPVKS